MDIKRNKEGQVIQDNLDSKTIDTNLTGAANGADLRLSFTVGKTQSVEKLDGGFTEFTHHPGGPAPLHPNQQ